MVHLRRHWCERPKLCARNVGNSTIIIHSRQQYSKPRLSKTLHNSRHLYTNPIQQWNNRASPYRTTTMHYSKQKGRVPYHTRKTTKSVSLLQRVVYSMQMSRVPHNWINIGWGCSTLSSWCSNSLLMFPDAHSPSLKDWRKMNCNE